MTRPPRGRPRLCAPDDVLDAAESLLRDGDASSVSIRRVADVLGVAPMTLYTSFATKQDLLDALARRLLDRHDLTPDRSLPLADRARQWMADYRQALNASRLFELMAAGASMTMLLELATTWGEQLVAEGFETDVAVRRVQFMLWTVHGFCATESSAARADRGALHAGAAALPPKMQPLAERFVETGGNADALFALVLDATVDAFARRDLTAPRTPRGG